MDTVSTYTLVEAEPIEAKDWFARKAFDSAAYSTEIWAIFGETEKALHVVLGSLFNHVFTWIPKACVVPATGEDDHTLRFESYDAMIEGMRAEQRLYR